MMPISIHAPHTGRDLHAERCCARSVGFQSTRPIRGATPATGRADPTAKFQSTRPIRGATYGIIIYKDGEPVFQSTRPIRGATWSSAEARAKDSISIHAPHTGRDAAKMQKINRDIISIHAPHTGRDSKADVGYLTAELFQSTRPIRGAT